jgi:hypothetical protein
MFVLFVVQIPFIDVDGTPIVQTTGVAGQSLARNGWVNGLPQ